MSEMCDVGELIARCAKFGLVLRAMLTSYKGAELRFAVHYSGTTMGEEFSDTEDLLRLLRILETLDRVRTTAEAEKQAIVAEQAAVVEGF